MIDASIALLKCVIDYGLCIWAFSWFAKRKSENRALFLGSIFLSSLFLFGINMLEIPWLNTIVSAFTLLVLFLVVFYTRWQQAFIQDVRNTEPARHCKKDDWLVTKSSLRVQTDCFHILELWMQWEPLIHVPIFRLILGIPFFQFVLWKLLGSWILKRI